MPPPLPVHVPVPLDALQPAGLARETRLDGTSRPAAGWFLLTLAALDAVGNVCGVAVVSGTALTAAATPPGVWAAFGVVFAQLGLVAGGARLLAGTPWRVWVVEAADEARRRPGPAAPLRAAAVVLGRVRRDAASLTGLLAGAAAAAAVSAFVAGRGGQLAEFFALCWVEGRFGYFRAVELFAVVSGGGWLLLLPGTRLHGEDVVYVTAPRDPAAAVHDLAAFTRFRTRRVVAHLLMSDLREAVVLVARADGGFTAVDPSAPLDLTRRRYTVVYLPAVSRWTFPPGTLADERGFLTATARLAAAPRMPPRARLPADFAPGALDPLLGLLRGRPGAELWELARRAFVDYVAAAGTDDTWEAVEVRLERLLGRIDDIPLSLPAAAAIRGNVARPDAAEVHAGLDDHQACHAALFAVERARADGERLADDWLARLHARVGGEAGVGAAFAAAVRARYRAAGPLDLLACLNLGVVATVAAAGGGNPGRELVRALNGRAADVRRDVLARVAADRDRVFDLLRARLAGADRQTTEVLRAVVAALPEVLPWFRSRPDELVRFIGTALGRFGGRPPRPGDLRALFDAARPPALPAPAGYP